MTSRRSTIRLCAVLALAGLLHPLSGVASTAAHPQASARECGGPPIADIGDSPSEKHQPRRDTCPASNAPADEPASAEETPSIRPGEGTFTLRVGPAGARKVEVFYFRPQRLTRQSPVLIVLPGAGRNASEYRGHWIDAAEKFGVLVLSLHYPESEYPGFWNYNLAGMISDVAIDPAARTMTGYRLRSSPREWLFDDVDRVFAAAVRGADLAAARYDLFGHSAGGQFLHRYALFAPAHSRAHRILAANSGWYTVPDRDEKFPYGLADAPITKAQLGAAFSRHLVVFLGGADDENETRGDLVRNAEANRQGLGRLARGRYFYERAAATAADLDIAFDWKLVVVPGVGHDPKRMSLAAAEYLYGASAGQP